MATLMSISGRRRSPLTIIVAVVVAFSLQSLGEAKDNKEEKTEEAPVFAVSGRDPMAFSDAEAMYAMTDRVPLDEETAKAIVAELDSRLQQGDAWTERLWSSLDQLRGSSASSKIVGLIQQVARKLVVPVATPPKSDAKVAKRLFEEGNQWYEAGQFGKATDSYRSALEHHPSCWDAWNNLGLVEMHQGNDLVAVFLLSALKQNNPRYAGGPINLSVCLERLDQGDAAYDVASKVVENAPLMPMAHYNAAWFENSRGDYEGATAHLAKATEPLPDYTVADWLQAVNMMESGQSLDAEEWDALPGSVEKPGIPEITTLPVVGSRADAFSGDQVVTEIPGGTDLVISEKSGDWYSFYWPVNNRKRRLWINELDLVNDVPVVAEADLGPFIGIWNGRWGTVTEKDLKIESVNGQPKVTMRSDTAWDEKIEDGRLTFRVRVGGSGWELVYTLTPVPEGLELEVFRERDGKTIAGMLKR